LHFDALQLQNGKHMWQKLNYNTGSEWFALVSNDMIKTTVQNISHFRVFFFIATMDGNSLRGS